MICVCGSKLCKLKMVSDILDHPVYATRIGLRQSLSLPSPVGITIYIHYENQSYYA